MSAFQIVLHFLRGKIRSSLTFYEILYRYRAAESILNEINIRAQHLANSEQDLLDDSGMHLDEEAFVDQVLPTRSNMATTAESDSASTSSDIESNDDVGIYVQGPQGVGKSHLLLQIAAYLRLTEPTYRVIYISNCEVWKTRKSYGARLRFLLHDIMMAFPDDTEVHMLVDKLYRMTRMYRDYNLEEETELFLDDLNTICDSKKLIPIWIIDDLNKLKEEYDEYPFVVYKTVLKEYGHVVVLSSSSNNTSKLPDVISGFKSFHFMNPFDDFEAKMFIENRFASIARQIETTPNRFKAFPTEQEFDAMRQVTLFYPLLLSGLCEHLILSLKEGELSEVSENYRLDWVKNCTEAFATKTRGDIFENHYWFLNGRFVHVDAERVKAAATAAIMDIGIEAGTYTLDRKYMYEELSPSSRYAKIKFFNPIFMEGVRSYYDRNLNALLNSLKTLMLAGVMLGSGFGQGVEWLVLQKAKTLGCAKIDTIKLKQDNSSNLIHTVGHINFNNLVREELYTLKEGNVDTLDTSTNPDARNSRFINDKFDTPEKRSKNYLLIPTTKNYKAIDYAILRRGPIAQTDELVLVQVKMTAPEGIAGEFKNWKMDEARKFCNYYINGNYNQLRVVFILRPASYVEILKKKQRIRNGVYYNSIYPDGHDTSELCFEVASVADIDGLDFIRNAKLSDGSLI
ncbi:uncharacterized protein VTP21DRAFT_1137 [Calcarisporiella thermophila]|uniref:uncharacterized protein n=1 Tax=Calcarisporiella thermophila TaxID=911321 RepID=UPI003742FFDD